MSANLIALGADLQQKLDAMDPKSRKARWAGDIGVAVFRIAQQLDSLNKKRLGRRDIPTAFDRTERDLMKQAQREVEKLGTGILAVPNPDPRAWPLVVVFPGDVPKGSGPEAVFEQGIAVPPRP